MRLDFPDPVGPTTAIRCPLLRVREISQSVGRGFWKAGERRRRRDREGDGGGSSVAVAVSEEQDQENEACESATATPSSSSSCSSSPPPCVCCSRCREDSACSSLPTKPRRTRFVAVSVSPLPPPSKSNLDSFRARDSLARHLPPRRKPNQTKRLAARANPGRG